MGRPTDTVSDELGVVEQRMSFDVWGKRRDRMSMNRTVKIVFELEPNENGSPPIGSESLHAIPLEDGSFVLDPSCASSRGRSRPAPSWAGRCSRWPTSGTPTARSRAAKI
ncbi:hypothetical protein [Enhygromyxa salina]|uniref:hypothetical protein n=1 Tax=Enhygromyxa salina TaxID=215803 RepID=UPI0011B1D4C5|nr:hypothetical protein [Enhygromyxa salina]